MKISTKEKSKLNNLKNKIIKWKKEGYNVDEIEKKVKTYENHELNQKKEVGKLLESEAGAEESELDKGLDKEIDKKMKNIEELMKK